VVNAIRLKQIPKRIVKMIDDELVIAIVIFKGTTDNVDMSISSYIYSRKKEIPLKNMC